MQIGQPAVVEGLGVFIPGVHTVVCLTDAGHVATEDASRPRGWLQTPEARRGARAAAAQAPPLPPVPQTWERIQSTGKEKGPGKRCRPLQTDPTQRTRRTQRKNVFSATFANFAFQVLKVEVHAHLEEPRLEHVGRTQPVAGRRVRECAAHGERPVVVEQVVGVEIEPRPELPHLD